MEDYYIGQIILFAGNFVPKYFRECDGSVLKVEDNVALFSLIGCTYGGDGKSIFNIPKIEPPKEGTKYIICVQGMYPCRN